MVSLQSECFDLWSVLNDYSLLFSIKSILGNNTKKFTVSNELFLQNNDIDYWKFEVIYVLHNGISSSAIQFKKNSPPSNGNCSIDPSTGTTNTLFRISCFNWFDEHQIKDYLTYGESLTFSIKNIEFKIFVLVWTNNDSQRLMIANSLTSTFQLRLPNVNRSNSFVNLNIHIRDRFDCFQQYNISDVRVQIDSTEIEDLFQLFKHSPSDIINNSLIQSLSIANQKNTQQILISTSHQFNQINVQNLDSIASSEDNILFERIMFLIILFIQMIFL